MSQENVEIVRQAIGVFRKLDLKSGGEAIGEGGITAAAKIFHPETELDATRAPMPDLRGTFKGATEVATFWSQWLEAWESLEFDDELRDARASTCSSRSRRWRCGEGQRGRRRVSASLARVHRARGTGHT